MKRRTDEPVSYATFESALGTCAVAWGPRGLRAVLLPERSAQLLRSRLRRQLGPVTEQRPPSAVRHAMGLLQRHLQGEPQDLSPIAIDLDEIGPFARRVYRALRQVGPGRTVTYAELAARAGSPGAARAVGQAMARNPLPLIVPCHRVLRADGQLGGFSAAGGSATKAELLRREGLELPT